MQPTEIKSVSDFAKYLDERKLGWEKKINIDELNMYNPVKCIVGQIYNNGDCKINNYNEGLKDLGIWTLNKTRELCSYSRYRDDWIKEIESRLSKKFGFEKALEHMKAGKKVKFGHWVVRRLNGLLVHDNTGGMCSLCDALFSENWELANETKKITQLAIGQKFIYLGQEFIFDWPQTTFGNLPNVFLGKCDGKIYAFSSDLEVEVINEG